MLIILLYCLECINPTASGDGTRRRFCDESILGEIVSKVIWADHILFLRWTVEYVIKIRTAKYAKNNKSLHCIDM